jgi:glycosyltransferase involved in cell wall biosynthesis
MIIYLMVDLAIVAQANSEYLYLCAARVTPAGSATKRSPLMKDKILLINYYWPPCGGSAVQRWLDISNYLDQERIQTFVVTIDEKEATFPSLDYSLEKRIASSTRVFRTATSELFYLYRKLIGKGKVPAPGMADESEPGFLQKIGRFARGNFFLPDPRRGWNKHALKQAIELIKAEDIKLVFTAGPPQSSHLIGLDLKKTFPDLVWIADFHDYWTDISHLAKFYRTAIAHFFDKRLELKVLQKADQVMTHCRSSKRILGEKLSTQESDKIFVHTMGYREDMFPEMSKGRRQEKFTITYTGIIAETYEPAVFFEAFAAALSRNPGIDAGIIFIGSAFPGLTAIVERTGLTSYFVNKGYIPHTEAIAAMGASSALLLINPRTQDEKNIVPGKLYEYLASFKPIVSISSHGSENEVIIQQCNAGANFNWDDKETLTGYIDTLMKQWLREGHVDLPYNERVHRYGRKYETHVLAERIRRIMAS